VEKALPKHNPESSLEIIVRVRPMGNVEGRNNLIFNKKRRTEAERWKQIIQNIREIIQAENGMRRIGKSIHRKKE